MANRNGNFWYNSRNSVERWLTKKDSALAEVVLVVVATAIAVVVLLIAARWIVGEPEIHYSHSTGKVVGVLKGGTNIPLEVARKGNYEKVWVP